MAGPNGARGPGANGGKSRMAEQMPGLPEGVSREMAEEMAAELNWWAGTYDHVQPGYLQFRLKVVPLAVRQADGDSAVVSHVRLIAATQLGPVVLHLPAAMAAELAGQLVDKARECDTGIATAGRSPLALPGQG